MSKWSPGIGWTQFLINLVLLVKKNLIIAITTTLYSTMILRWIFDPSLYDIEEVVGFGKIVIIITVAHIFWDLFKTAEIHFLDMDVIRTIVNLRERENVINDNELISSVLLKGAVNAARKGYEKGIEVFFNIHENMINERKAIIGYVPTKLQKLGSKIILRKGEKDELTDEQLSANLNLISSDVVTKEDVAELRKASQTVADINVKTGEYDDKATFDGSEDPDEYEDVEVDEDGFEMI